MPDLNKPEDAAALEQWLAPRRLHAEPHTAIRPARARWLWRHRIPLGAITLLAGKQGTGKSTLTAELGARVTHGELEGDLYRAPANIVLISYEDNVATTIVPRFTVAGADLARVFQLDAIDENYDHTITLPADLGETEQVIREHQPRLLVIDPLVATLPSNIDAHRDQDVRYALAPLNRLAVRYDLAIVGLIHWNKSASTDALTRISGSTAFSAAARSVLAFGTHPHQEEDDGTRVIAHAKSNLGPIAPSLEFRLEPCQLPLEGDRSLETVRIRRVGECSIATHELFSIATDAARSKLDDAILFLRDELADHRWREKDAVAKAAQQERIARNTLIKAANKIGVEFRRHGFPSKGQWRLPPVVPSLFDSE